MLITIKDQSLGRHITHEDLATFQLNHGAVGVFRTMYSSDMLKAFVFPIQDRTISAADRYILHADLYALVKSGYVSTGEILSFTRAYENETDYSVWTSVR